MYVIGSCSQADRHILFMSEYNTLYINIYSLLFDLIDHHEIAFEYEWMILPSGGLSSTIEVDRNKFIIKNTNDKFVLIDLIEKNIRLYAAGTKALSHIVTYGNKIYLFFGTANSESSWINTVTHTTLIYPILTGHVKVLDHNLSILGSCDLDNFKPNEIVTQGKLFAIHIADNQINFYTMSPNDIYIYNFKLKINLFTTINDNLQPPPPQQQQWNQPVANMIDMNNNFEVIKTKRSLNLEHPVPVGYHMLHSNNSIFQCTDFIFDSKTAKIWITEGFNKSNPTVILYNNQNMFLLDTTVQKNNKHLYPYVISHINQAPHEFTSCYQQVHIASAKGEGIICYIPQNIFNKSEFAQLVATEFSDESAVPTIHTDLLADDLPVIKNYFEKGQIPDTVTQCLLLYRFLHKYQFDNAFLEYYIQSMIISERSISDKNVELMSEDTVLGSVLDRLVTLHSYVTFDYTKLVFNPTVYHILLTRINKLSKLIPKEQEDA